MLNQLEKEISAAESVNLAKEIWAKLERKELPDDISAQKYADWKEKIHVYLRLRYSIIKGEILWYVKTQWKMNLLAEELKDYKSYTDINRVKYEKRLTNINIALSYLNPLMMFAIALSFIDSVEIIMKIISLAISTICIAMTGYCKSCSLEGKWQQRTTTYLRLDELERDLRYETDCSQTTVDKYVERFKQIIIDDDLRCEENTKMALEHFKSVSQNKLKTDK